MLAAYKGHDFLQQQAFVNSRAKYNLVGAASRTGKTYGAGDNFMHRVIEDYGILGFSSDYKHEVTYWCIAPTYYDCIAQKLELLRLIPNYMIDWMKQGEKRQFFDTSIGSGTLFIVGGRKIVMRSAEHPESLVATKVRGIWWTEIARSKVKAWPNVYARLSNYDDSWLIADTSPLGRCWFYEQVWEPAKRGKFVGAECHEWTAIDSPYVSQKVIDAARENLSPAHFAREFMASWAAFQGQVFSHWERKLHVREQAFKTERIVISIDINTTSESPAAIGTNHIGGECVDRSGITRPRMHLAREYYEVIGLDYQGYARTIAAEYLRCVRMVGKASVTIIIDPSAHTEFKRMLTELGVPWKLAKNQVKQGIRTLGGIMVKRKQIQAPLYTVDPTCIHFPNEVEGYAYKVTSAGVVSEEPEKTNDHMLDNQRYAAMQVYSGYGQAKQVK